MGLLFPNFLNDTSDSGESTPITLYITDITSISFPFSILSIAAPTPFRDRDIYESIKAMLVATGEFATNAVKIPKSPSDSRLRPDDSPWAIIEPTSDRTVPDGSPTREFHVCTYELTFGVRETEEPEDTYQSEIDRIYAVIRNTVMSSPNRTFGGRCLSNHTKLSDGSIQSGGWPDMQRSLRGEFAYSVSLAASSYSIIA